MKANTQTVTRDIAIAEIKKALRERSGKNWSVTGGKGTAWGWISIESVPARRTWSSRPLPHNMIAQLPGRENWEEYDTGEKGHHMSPEDRKELSELLGVEVHHQGESIPASSRHYLEYIARARGENPTVIGEQYWD